MLRAPGLAVAVAVLLAAASAAAQQPPAPPPGLPPGAPMPVPGAAAPAPPAPGVPPAGAFPQPGAPGPFVYGAPPGAPQGYYPQPYYYPPPMAVLPPATLPYLEGEPVPQGYEVKTRPVRSMVLAGAITFGSIYLASALTAASLIAADSSDNGGYAPLFVPIAGPFVAIGTLHSSGAGTLWLVLDGLGQVAGATMLIYGLASSEKYLRRTPVAVLTHPDVLVGPGSTSLRWQF